MSGKHRLLRASAGTGKTYRLVEAYLEAVRGGLRPSQVVAITFTRKAAGELRTRVRRRLRASGVEQGVLNELSSAPVSSFHGLALQMLRGFGFSGGLREGVALLGENGDDRALFLDVCEEAWFSGEPEVVEAVEKVAPHFSVDDRLPAAIWDVLQRAREDGRSLEPEELLAPLDPQAAMQDVHRDIVAFRASLAAAALGQKGKSREKIDAFLAAAVPDPAVGIAAWAQAWERAGAVLDRRGTLGKLFDGETLRLVKANGSKPARTREPVAVEVCAGLRQPLGRLIRVAWDAYQEAKQARRVCDFGDLVVDLVDLLTTRADLHRGVCERYRAVLVDEAQDTNRLQRRLVRLLAGLEGPAATASEAASLLVVGDRKQAIYTFRGADPDSFRAFTDDVIALGGEEEILEQSRRSVPELVEGINSLGRSLFGDAYDVLAPLPDPTADRGPLGRPAMTWVELPADGPGGVAGVLAEAGALASLVHEEHERGTPIGDFALLLSAMTRAPLYVAALARRGIPAVLGGGGGLYEQPEIADVISLLVWTTDATNRLAAAVALRSPIFGLSDSGLLSLFGRDSREGDSLLSLRRGDRPAVATTVASDEQAFDSLAELLPLLTAAARAMGAAEFLAFADHLLDLRAVYLALDGGEQRIANLDRLWELARDHDASGRGGVGRFAREQSERMHRQHKEPVVPVPAPLRRAVTVTTIHQSKGLQYPRVILADVRNPGANDTASLRFERDHGVVFRPLVGGERMATPGWQAAGEASKQARADEQRRMLYVAVTRAQKEVFILGVLGKGSRSTGFGKLLDGWVGRAREEGVLVVRQPRPPAQLGLPFGEHQEAKDEDRAWAAALVQSVMPRAAPAGSVFALPVTSIETYLQCARRGFLVHDLHLQEPRFAEPRLRWPATDDRDPPLDALTRGRLAHAVLAVLERCPSAEDAAAFIDRQLSIAGYDPGDSRLDDVRRDVLAFIQSEVGRALLALGTERRRHELPFRLALPAGDYVAMLHGQIDLLVWDDDGPLVIDYKHARAQRSGLEAYRTQLGAYALAAERLCKVDGDIRTRIVFLKDRSTAKELVVTAAMRRDLEARVATVTDTLARHRGLHRAWPGQERAACERLDCGFLCRCHGDESR